MPLGHSAPPGSKFRIGDGVRLLRVARRGLQVAMAQPLADGGEADASVDELRRVGMAQLVQSGVDASGSTVRNPVLVGRLIAQRTTPAVLLSAEQRAMPVAGVAEVSAQLDNQAVGIDQHRASPATLTEHGQVLIVAGKVDVFNLERKCRSRRRWAGIAARMADLSRAQPSWCGWIEMDPVEPPHRVSADELVTVGPGEEARNRRLLAGS